MNPNELNIDTLQEVLKRVNLNMNDVLKEAELMKRENILSKHLETYKIWLADDGRWKTKLPDGSKYGKLVARATKENLENFIIDFYVMFLCCAALGFQNRIQQIIVTVRVETLRLNLLGNFL